jgi:hypothetical protein
VSIEGMAEAWRELAPLSAGFYGEVREPLVVGQTLNAETRDRLRDRLGEMLGCSARIREHGASAIAEDDDPTESESAAELLLAAACTDALLARDLAALDPAADGSGPDVDEKLSLANVSAEGRSLFAEVDAAFEALGRAPAEGTEPASPDRDAVEADVRRSVASLLTAAEQPARALLDGLRVALRKASLSGIELMAQDAGADQGSRSLALGFLKEQAAKVDALQPPGWGLSETAADVDGGADALTLLQNAAATMVTEERAQIWVKDAPMITAAGAEALRASLVELENGYARQMQWLSKSTPWLRRGACALDSIASADDRGASVVPTVFAANLGFVAFSLADRLDARRLPLDLVKGLVPLVEEHVAY